MIAAQSRFPVVSWMSRTLPAWAWVGLLALGLRLIGLGAEDLWYDESFTWWVTRLPGDRFWAAIAGDVHPPFYYLIIRLLAPFGESEAWLRLPSAICGVGAVLLVYRLAREYLDERGALLAGIIAALLPVAGLYYSQEARMYALLALLLLAALYAALKRRWLLYVGAAGLAVYTQNLAVLYVAALGLACLLAGPDRRRALLANAAVAAAWLPWAVVMLGQMRSMSAADGFWLWPLNGVGEVLLPLPVMTVGMRTPGWAQMQAFALVFGLTLICLIACRRRLSTRSGLLLLAVIFGGPALIALASLLWRNVYLHRTLIASAMALPVLWEVGLSGLSLSNRRIALVLLAFALGLGILGHHFPESRGDRQPVEAWLAPVRAGWREGDVIYHPSLLTAVMSRYYTQGLDERIWRSGEIEQGLSTQTQLAMGFDVAAPEQLVGQGFRRAWVLWQTHPLSTLEEQGAILDFVSSHPNRLISLLYQSRLGDVALYEVNLVVRGRFDTRVAPAVSTLLALDERDCGFVWGPQMIDAGADFLAQIDPLSACAVLAAQGR